MPVPRGVAAQSIAGGRSLNLSMGPATTYHGSIWLLLPAEELTFLDHERTLAYWSAVAALRCILGRTYRVKYLRDKRFTPWSARTLTLLAVAGYFVWAGVLFGAVYVLYNWGPTWLGALGRKLVSLVTG